MANLGWVLELKKALGVTCRFKDKPPHPAVGDQVTHLREGVGRENKARG